MADDSSSLVDGQGERTAKSAILPGAPPPPPPPFDVLVITASNPEQAAAFRELVAARSASFPRGLRVRCYSDPPGGRVGSGGGTLVALAMLLRDELGLGAPGDGGHAWAGGQAEVGAAELADAVRQLAVGSPGRLRAFFEARRVLLVHAGGESRRLPAYAPEGKLFAPVPGGSFGRGLPNAPVILDRMVAFFCAYPWAASGELLLASGDALVGFEPRGLFAPLPADGGDDDGDGGEGGGDDASAAARAVRGSILGFGCGCSFEQGSRHGVFELGADGAEGGQAEAAQAGGAGAGPGEGGGGGGRYGRHVFAVRAFHQKAPPALLASAAALPAAAAEALGLDTRRAAGGVRPPAEPCCALDVGLFALAPEWCAAFVAFGTEPADAAAGAAGPTVLARVLAAPGAGAGGPPSVCACSFDFYLEAVSAAVADPRDAEGYAAAMRAAGSALPPPLLRALHSRLCRMRLRVALPLAASFAHFGSLDEFPRACALLAAEASEPGAEVEARVLLLNCEDVSVARQREEEGGAGAGGAGGGGAEEAASVVEGCRGCSLTLSARGPHLLVGLEGLRLAAPIPQGLCLDGRRLPPAPSAGLRAGPEVGQPRQVVLVYSRADSFKPVASAAAATFCGRPLLAWLSERGLRPEDVGLPATGAAAARFDLWSAPLFAHGPGLPPDFVRGYWDGEWAAAHGWADAFRRSARASLRQANGFESAAARDGRRTEAFRRALGGAGAADTAAR